MVDLSKGERKISDKPVRIIAITLIIVIIIISSGLFIKYSYWNIDLNISEIGYTEQNITFQCELINTGFNTISILDPYFSFRYHVDSSVGLSVGPIAIIDFAPSDITLDADESHIWQITVTLNEIMFNTGVDIDKWPVGETSVHCTYNTHGKLGNLKSNTITFTIE